MKHRYDAKTKLTIFLPIALAALGMQGCRWDDSMYERYVKDDKVVECKGYYLLSLNDGRYIRQINETDWACGDYDTVGLPEQVTKSVICESDAENGCCTKDEISLAEDAMGKGLCPRKAHNCVPRVLANGKISNKNKEMCSECDPGQIKCGDKCVNTKENSSHCGSCSGLDAVCDFENEHKTCVNGECNANCEGLICKVDGVPQCVDKMNDPKHCGKCDNDCTKEGQTICNAGKCDTKVELSKCSDPFFTCYKVKDHDLWLSPEDFEQLKDEKNYELENKDNPECVSPANEKTCNATGCMNYTSCADSYICVAENEGESYACKCPSGTVEIETTDATGETTKRCADPNEMEHCGINNENKKGINCTTLSDAALRACNGTSCVCKPGYVECEGNCIDPLTEDKFCGVDEKCQNGATCDGLQGQNCIQGRCECPEGKLNCEGDCISPSENQLFCGAKGLCNSDDSNSENYKGISCEKASRQCVIEEGIPKCQCDEDEHYDVITEKCVVDSSPNSCGIEDPVDCTAIYHPEAKCKNNKCTCPGGLVRIDESPYWEKYQAKQNVMEGSILVPTSWCIDINYDNEFCGQNLETCNGDQICIKGECKVLNDLSKSECTSGSKRVVCGNRCIHLNDNNMENCGKCASGWCSNGVLPYIHGCHGKIGYGMYNCTACYYGEGEAGKKCNDRYSICDSNKCSCNYNETDLMIDGNYMCVNFEEKKITTCSGESCVHGFTCRDGWGDCKDGNSTNTSGVADGKIGTDGCETNIYEGQSINTDDKVHTIENCGACNQTCEPSNVESAICSFGQCKYSKCISSDKEAYGDCDGNTANGCESDLHSIDNCGVCGKKCSEGGCEEDKDKKEYRCCWNNTKYTTGTLTQDDCCDGTELYQACNKNWFRDTRYTCAKGTPTIDTGGWCSWSKVN